MIQRHKKIVDALEHRVGVQKLCIRDADEHNAALLKVRLNECQTILQCIESGTLELL